MTKQCKICLHDIKNPLFLECAHGFCLKCIIRLIRSRNRKCPMCRCRIVWTVNCIHHRYDIPHKRRRRIK